jgi:hypothetical protein
MTMRGTGWILLATLAFYSAPAAASFDAYGLVSKAKLTLQSESPRRLHSATLLDERAQMPRGPEASLKLADPLDISEMVKMAGGGAGRGGAEPFVAFVLGFIGFGLGHWYAGDGNFMTWTIIDVIILAVAILTFVVDMGVFALLFYVAWVAERVLEGVLAYQISNGTGSRTPKLVEAEPAEAPAAARRFDQPLGLVSFSF